MMLVYICKNQTFTGTKTFISRLNSININFCLFHTAYVSSGVVLNGKKDYVRYYI